MDARCRRRSGVRRLAHSGVVCDGAGGCIGGDRVCAEPLQDLHERLSKGLPERLSEIKPKQESYAPFTIDAVVDRYERAMEDVLNIAVMGPFRVWIYHALSF